MSISTLSELKAAVAEWINRDDQTANIATAITLAEAMMSRDLKVRSLESRATATLTAGDGYTLLPSDLRSIRSVKLQTNPVAVVEYVTPDSMDINYDVTATGQPRVFSIIGGEIKWGPIPDSGYTAEIIYGTGITALASDDATNTILTRYPDAYLKASLAEMFALLEDPQRADWWRKEYGAAVAAINRTESEARHGGFMRMRAV